jgi:hypothetical protein
MFLPVFSSALVKAPIASSVCFSVSVIGNPFGEFFSQKDSQKNRDLLLPTLHRIQKNRNIGLIGRQQVLPAPVNDWQRP